MKFSFFSSFVLLFPRQRSSFVPSIISDVPSIISDVPSIISDVSSLPHKSHSSLPAKLASS